MYDFNQKIALVTGGTRGIGRSIVDQLLESGCQVLVTGTKTNPDPDFLHKKMQFLQLDLESRSSLDDFLERLSLFKQIDILVNNAGINIVEAIDELDPESWNRMVQVNLTGPAIMTKTVAQKMKKNGYGRIVNISSIWGIHSREKRSSYSSTKSGLLGLTRATALDLSKHGILVNAVCPGFTNTELTRSILPAEEQKLLASKVPLGRFAETDEIAKLVLFLCSEANTYMTGQTLVIDGGYTIT